MAKQVQTKQQQAPIEVEIKEVSDTQVQITLPESGAVVILHSPKMRDIRALDSKVAEAGEDITATDQAYFPLLILADSFNGVPLEESHIDDLTIVDFKVLSEVLAKFFPSV